MQQAEPVSYTHLDVYKRQVFGCGDVAVVVQAVDAGEGGVLTAPVSYTHLDVYKRQVSSRSGWRS